MAFRLTRRAEEDIIRIAELGLRAFGEVQARQYHSELFALFELLASNPMMARERREVTPPVRVHPFKAHLIVYKLDTGGGILIVRVRHAHEDWADRQ